MPHASRGNGPGLAAGVAAMNPSESSALTCAEQEIVHHVLLGWTNKQIATCRGTSVGTVANQIAAIYQKLGISSRADLLVRFAVSPQEPG
ncbi:MAG: response regulator transcription factor, partial [Myxococcaceae bacterium]